MTTTAKQLNATTDSLRWAINSYKSAVGSELDNELPGIIKQLNQIDPLLKDRIRKGVNSKVIQVARSCADEARGIVSRHSQETVTKSEVSRVRRVISASRLS